MKVNIKYQGDCKNDFGLFSDELADASTDVPEYIWSQFLSARAMYEMWYQIVNSYKQKKI